MKNRKKRFTALDYIVLGVVSLFVIWSISASMFGELPYNWQWHLFSEMFFVTGEMGNLEVGLFIRGVLLTIKLTIYSFIIALFIGIPMGIARTSTFYPIKSFSNFYVGILRNLPPIITVFVVTYFFGATLFNQISYPEADSFLGRQFSFWFTSPSKMALFLSGIISLGLYEGAYVTEIVRAGIESLPKGQKEAGKVLGLSEFKIYQKIILPQAFYISLPPLASEIISALKMTSILSIIALPELTMRGGDVQKLTRAPFESWIVTATLYFILAYTVSLLIERLYKKSS